MKRFLLFIALVLSFAFDANAAKQSKTQGDETSEVICSIVKYTQSIGGPMITVVINPNYGLEIGYNIKKRNRKSASYTITNPCITESLLIPIAGRKVLNISNLQISEVKMILCYSN